MAKAAMSSMASAKQTASVKPINWEKWAIVGPPSLFLIIFFVVPALIMVVVSFLYPGEFEGVKAVDFANLADSFTTETYEIFFGDWFYFGIFGKSFGIAFLSTLLCLIIAYPLALTIARRPKHQRDLMILLVILPFASNFLVRIYAWMIILGPQSAISVALNGVLGFLGFEPVRLLFSSFAVIVGMVYVHLPFMILPLYTNLEKHDPDLLYAAQDLGANAWHRFWKVTFPLSLPGVFAGSVLVFVPVLGMFAVPELLGGTGDFMIGNLIKEQFFGTRDWPLGSAFSILLMIFVLLLTGLSVKLASFWTDHQRAEG